MILKGLASGLAYMHHFPIIHGDLKPENVVLTAVSEEVNLENAIYLSE